MGDQIEKIMVVELRDNGVKGDLSFQLEKLVCDICQERKGGEWVRGQVGIKRINGKRSDVVEEIMGILQK